MPTPYPEEEGFVSVQGHRLYFRSLGRARLGTILVVHGGPSEHRYLSCLGDLVPHGYRVVWYDQWGCGRSERPASFDSFTVEGAGAEVVGVADALRLRRPHLFGHSWGGALALEAATSAPRRFQSVILCGAFASDPSLRVAMRRHVRALPNAIRAPIEKGEREGRFDDLRYRAALRRRRREYSLGMRVLPFELAATEPTMNRRLLRAIYGIRVGLFAPARGALRDWDVRPRLPRLTRPCLILAGEHEAGRYTALEIHRLVPGSRLVLVPGAAHLPFLQCRDPFMEIVLRFLLRTGASGYRGRPRKRNVLNGRSSRGGR